MRLDKGEEIMSYYNTIRLLKGTAFLTTREYKNFEPGDTIWGNDSDAEEISRWNEDEKEKALDALKNTNAVIKNRMECMILKNMH